MMDATTRVVVVATYGSYMLREKSHFFILFIKKSNNQMALTTTEYEPTAASIDMAKTRCRRQGKKTGRS